jgi:hypothetical protein
MVDMVDHPCRLAGTSAKSTHCEVEVIEDAVVDHPRSWSIIAGPAAGALEKTGPLDAASLRPAAVGRRQAQSDRPPRPPAFSPSTPARAHAKQRAHKGP